MKIPRSVSGAYFADVLCRRWEYTKVNQVGSHVVLETSQPTHQRIAVPDHNPLRFHTRRDYCDALRGAMPRISKAELSADKIAEKASRGEDVSGHFSNKFTVVRPVRRVNVDLTEGLLRQLDHRAARLNISRQAVIKTLLWRALSEEEPSHRGRRK